jgi:phage minor structural protein
MNQFQYNTAQFNQYAATSAAEDHRVRKYLLQLRTNSGTLIRNIQEFWDGTWNQEILRPDRLTFTTSSDDDFTVNREIWLYTAPETVAQKFRVHRIDTRRDTEYTVTVEAYSLISKLEDDVIVDYEATATAQNHIKTWLSSTYQNDTPRISLGHITSSLGSQSVSLSLQGVTIYEALDRLHESIGGEYYVGPNRRLYWYTRMGAYTGQQIRYRKNLIGIEKSVDRSELATRIYAYGAGNTKDSQVALTAPGYVEANTGTYGVVSRVLNAREITDQATLTVFANAALALTKTPTTTYDCDALDLSKDQSGGFSFDTIALGNRYRVIDEVCGVSEILEAMRVERSLDNPLRVKLALSKRRKTIDQLLRDILKRLDKTEEREVIFNDAMNAEVVGPDDAFAGDSGVALHDNARIPIDVASVAGALAGGALATINKWVPYDGE